MENATVNATETVKVKGSKVTLPSVIGPIAVQLIPAQDEQTAEKVSVLSGRISSMEAALEDLKHDIEEDGRDVSTSKAYARKAYDLQMRQNELARLAPVSLTVETLNSDQVKLVNSILSAITAWCDPIVRKRYTGNVDGTGTFVDVFRDAVILGSADDTDTDQETQFINV